MVSTLLCALLHWLSQKLLKTRHITQLKETSNDEAFLQENVLRSGHSEN